MALKVNTAISQMMILVNAVYKEIAEGKAFPRRYAEGLCKLLNPVIPFLTEEIWNESLGHSGTMAYESWPTFDESRCGEDMFEYAVQVNSKIKAKIMLPADADAAEARQKVTALGEVAAVIDGKAIKKFIFVPKRLINIIV